MLVQPYHPPSRGSCHLPLRQDDGALTEGYTRGESVHVTSDANVSIKHERSQAMSPSFRILGALPQTSSFLEGRLHQDNSP
jgi:hypothetical protein